MMTDLRTLQTKILANGKIEGHEVELLRNQLSADGKIDRKEAELLIELYKRVDQIAPAFEQFFYKIIKQHVLTNDTIDAEIAAWLRQMIFADGKVNEREKKLLRELKGEASRVSPEFQALYEECLT